MNCAKRLKNSSVLKFNDTPIMLKAQVQQVFKNNNEKKTENTLEIRLSEKNSLCTMLMAYLTCTWID